jgi:acetyl-CoA carboxylase biotin carboxyl carrier protein
MPPFEIDPKMIRKLAELMTETGLSEIEMAEGDRRVRVSRATVAAAPVQVTASAPAPAPGWLAGEMAATGAVISPMVGTAYLQGEPGAPAFVSIGDTIRVGDTLLIIEAMKVMNPIKASKSGKLTQILISDGQPVEYGEPLMIVE